MAYTRPAKRNNFRGRRNNNYSNNSHNSSQSSGNQSSVVDFKTYKKYQANREKYIEMARNALSNGDRVEAENYFQHADHYLRLINLSAKQYENVRDNRSLEGQNNNQPATENVSAQVSSPNQVDAGNSENNISNVSTNNASEINPAENSAEARLPGFITN